NGDASSRDQVRISLPAESTDAQSTEIKLLRSLGAVATRHRLTQDQPARTGNELSFLVRQAGIPTHVIEIDHLAAAATLKKTGDGSARLAIILDDLGADRASADAIFALGYPLTLSVLPGHEHSTEIAKEAHRRGLEVMLHLPMQASAEGQPEAKELRPGMGEEEVAATIDEFLQAVPDAAGVNNHQGSQATADPALMRELMPALRERQLFYVDSRTTAATVAFDVAKDAGVPCAFRNVPFLDDVAQVAAVRRQLQLAFRGAREKGEALAIGHPHAATLEALRTILPEAKQQGIQLVFASDVVH
ncbi:MAG TPA: divergent polysaccharide deacetylase family protein, partial [Candidatus Acidoferrales bacterium]|nr:divergent polysaccharide deacetylase family protein [Candidatus Acidoferrales bacterium]